MFLLIVTISFGTKRQFRWCETVFFSDVVFSGENESDTYHYGMFTSELSRNEWAFARKIRLIPVSLYEAAGTDYWQLNSEYS